MGIKWKQWQILFSWAPKSLWTVTAVMKLRCLLLERKAMTNLDSILKSRDITLPKKIHIVKALVFPTVIYRCESWTMKKAEYQRIDAFELWCWRRLLRVPWIARRSNQSILKEINPEYSIGKTDAEAEALILWPPDANSQLIGKDPDTPGHLFEGKPVDEGTTRRGTDTPCIFRKNPQVPQEKSNVPF